MEEQTSTCVENTTGVVDRGMCWIYVHIAGTLKFKPMLLCNNIF